MADVRLLSRSISTSFQADSQLRQYFLDGVVPTGKALGSGSYGNVIEVKFRQTPCAAKRMHELLLDPGNQGVRENIQKYRQECQLMASLRHPNITQFLGLCFLEGSELPLLVMEKLEMSVDDLLECAPNIPLPVKISILTDTCSGLVYLHSRTPPIVHRDLTARNVLLTSSLTAKITDLGNSRMVTLRPSQLAQTLSKNPGTTVYMPPEALSESHRYGPSLDVFSFGHLALVILTQEYPELLASIYVDSRNPDSFIGRSEVERRGDSIKNLEQQFILYPSLVELVTNCLHNNATMRPSADRLLQTLQPIQNGMEKFSGWNSGKVYNAANLLHAKEMNYKDKLIEGLKFKLDSALDQLAILSDEKQKLEDNISQHSYAKDVEISQLKFQVNKLELENEEVRRELKELKYSVLNKKKSSGLTFSSLSQLHWKRGSNMPVGGGITSDDVDQFSIMAFNNQSKLWSKLPAYHTRWFGMTTISNKLILVGGSTIDSDVSNHLGVYHVDKSKWEFPFSPMPTSRMCCSVCSYKHWLVVAGGYNYDGDLSTVEILDTDSSQWSTGPPSSTPLHSMKSAIIGDTWYLMGGVSKESLSQSVYSVSLQSLISQSHVDGLEIWHELLSLDRTCSCPVNMDGVLLAIGGEDMENKPVSTIQRYVPESNAWAQAGLLPHAVFSLTSIVVADEFFVMGGHDGKAYHCEMFSSLLS